MANLKYRCDICQVVDDYESNRNKDYYGYTDNYGYCDNLECKKIAKDKTRSDKSEALWQAASDGNFEAFESIVGDGDAFDII